MAAYKAKLTPAQAAALKEERRNQRAKRKSIRAKRVSILKFKFLSRNLQSVYLVYSAELKHVLEIQSNSEQNTQQTQTPKMPWTETTTGVSNYFSGFPMLEEHRISMDLCAQKQLLYAFFLRISRATRDRIGTKRHLDQQQFLWMGRHPEVAFHKDLVLLPHQSLRGSSCLKQPFFLPFLGSAAVTSVSFTSAFIKTVFPIPFWLVYA